MILVVTKRRGLFVLHDCSDPNVRVAVQSQNAQGILDYAATMFPGTPVFWCITPAADAGDWIRIPSAVLERVA